MPTKKTSNMREPTARDAYVLSLFSLVLTAIAVVIGIAMAAVTKSAAMLAFGLENLVDSFSSMLVLWRFWGGGMEGSPSEDDLETREKRASVGIAFSFILLAVIVGGIASAHLAREEAPDALALLIGLSLPCVLIFFVLGLVKMYVGVKLDSPSMKKDAVCSLCGAVLSAGTTLGAIMMLSGADSWWFDSVVAVVICMGLFVYACVVLIRNAMKKDPSTGAWAPEMWWTLSWWHTPGKIRHLNEDERGGGLGPGDGLSKAPFNEL